MAINFLNDGNFADNAKLQFGNSNDLEIYHDGSNSYIAETGTGRLTISGGSDIRIESPAGEMMADFNSNSSVDLYHNNVRVFSTGSTGITIQGNSNDITFVNDSTTDYNYLKVFVPDTTVNVIGIAQEKVGLFANGSEALTIISDGSVGIGTTLPGNLLHVEGNTTLAGDVFMADNDTLRIGSKASTGDLTLFHNGTNSFIENATGDLYVDSNGDDLFLQSDDDVIIRSQGSENAIYCTGNAGVQIYHNASEKLETKSDGIEVTGNIDLNSNGEIELDGNGGMLLNTVPSGTEGNGIIIKLHSSSTTAGSIYYKSNLAAAWSLADADSDSATRMLAVALGSNSGTSGMLLQGIFRKASHGFSAGAPLYVSTTAGAFTTTAPSGSGDYVRVVGYVIDSNTIYFSPGTAWVEVS
tara:strand:- start:6 stop:1241 length:1236 start_codon:yes stop_codon:yes gene_type:complete